MLSYFAFCVSFCNGSISSTELDFKIKLMVHGDSNAENPSIRQSPCTNADTRLSPNVSLKCFGHSEFCNSATLKIFFIRTSKLPSSARAATAKVASAEPASKSAAAKAAESSAESTSRAVVASAAVAQCVSEQKPEATVSASAAGL